MESKTIQTLEVLSPSLNNNENVVCSQESLPPLLKEKSIMVDYTYQYQGFWYTPPSVQGVIDCQQHFRPRENDIILVTAPKSGTTWLKAILFALVNHRAYHPQDPTHPLLKKTPHQLVPFFELTRPSEYDSVYSDSISRIFGCHFPITSLPKSIFEDDISTNNCKIVYLCRDIKDTFASLFHFANNANLRSCPIDLEEAFDLFCKGITAGGPIWDQILGYWKASLEWPEKVLFMRYEELKYEPRVQLRHLAKFIGKPFSEEEETSGMIDEITSLCSFGNMSKVKVNMTGDLLDGLPNCSFFRSGVIGDGKKCLTAPMAAKLDQITKDKFSGSGLSL